MLMMSGQPWCKEQVSPFLWKPFSLNDLRDSIEALLGRPIAPLQ